MLIKSDKKVIKSNKNVIKTNQPILIVWILGFLWNGICFYWLFVKVVVRSFVCLFVFYMHASLVVLLGGSEVYDISTFLEGKKRRCRRFFVQIVYKSVGWFFFENNYLAEKLFVYL